MKPPKEIEKRRDAGRSPGYRDPLGYGSGYQEGFAEAEKYFEAKYKPVVEALITLLHESKGTMTAHQVAIGYDHGNSNWQCLELAWKEAEGAIAKSEEKEHGFAHTPYPGE